MLKQKMEEKLAQEIADLKSKPQTLKEDSWAHFILQYPYGWSVENWKGGVTLRNNETKEYFSLFQQTSSRGGSKDTTEIDGKKAFSSLDRNAGGEFRVLEIVQKGGWVLEINSNAKDFDKIISSLKFTK
jgi:hypothetical protein